MIAPEEHALRAWHFKRLRWSLQALAEAGSNQPLLFPDSASTADELALDFDHWASVVRSTYDPELSADQAATLGTIDRTLATMTRDGAEFGLELWTDAALRNSEQWTDVRRQAGAALEAFGWREASGDPAVEEAGTAPSAEDGDEAHG